jgi:hypothetical protein
VWVSTVDVSDVVPQLQSSNKLVHSREMAVTGIYFLFA